MKIKNKFLLLLLVLTTTCNNAIAKNLNSVSISAASFSMLELNLNDVQSAKVDITLKDLKGVILHNETLFQESIKGRKYNLKNLPEGTYFFIVSHDDQTQLQKIEITEDGLSVDSEDLQTLFNPVITVNDEFVDLNMLNLSDFEMSLEIWDNKGHKLYTEKVTDKGSLQRRFNLSMLKKDVYTVRIAFEDYAINKEYIEKLEWSPTIVALN